MSQRALIIGIDSYPKSPLTGCVNDATSVAYALEKNGDGSPNFEIDLLTSDKQEVTTFCIRNKISKLFSGDVDTVLFYFSGHGYFDKEANSGYLVSQNGNEENLGYPLSDLLKHANDAYPHIKSTLVILDCCHAGFLGETPVMDLNVSAIGTGVTMLAACHRDQSADEQDGHGVFTQILVDGLEGSAADILGNITPAAVYAHVDQTLGAWEQRPIYKANVMKFTVLKKINPKISLVILRKLVEYFSNPDEPYPLDPSYEPDRQNVPEEYRYIPINPEHARIFKNLQDCNRYGLIRPVNEDHMYYAAIHSTGCELTALGKFYWRLAQNEKL
jgi:hypothetical protein